MRLRQISVVLAGAFAVLAALFVGPAQGATDTTPPVWSKPPTNSIALGTQVQPAGILGDCDSWYMPTTISFAAKDPESGISRYGEGSYEDVSQDATTVKSPVQHTSWVIDNTCGCGGCEGENYFVWNTAGLHAAWNRDEEGLAVVQDDRFNGSTSESQAAGVADLQGVYMTYNGTWATSAANAFSGGTTQKTTQSGASATLHINNQPYWDSFGQVDYGLGLVMAKAPDRGKAAIFVDGVRVATVDTYAASKLNRTVVWRQTMAGNTGHTVKVVNLATAGRTRIDIDAFVLLQKVHGYPLDPAEW